MWVASIDLVYSLFVSKARIMILGIVVENGELNLRLPTALEIIKTLYTGARRKLICADFPCEQ